MNTQEERLLSAATTFTFTVKDSPTRREIRVELCVDAIDKAADRWAIRFDSQRLSRAGVWSFEPIPSSRSDAYIEAHTFKRDEAVVVAERIAEDGHDALYRRAR